MRYRFLEEFAAIKVSVAINNKVIPPTATAANAGSMCCANPYAVPARIKNTDPVTSADATSLAKKPLIAFLFKLAVAASMRLWISGIIPSVPTQSPFNAETGTTFPRVTLVLMRLGCMYMDSREHSYQHF